MPGKPKPKGMPVGWISLPTLNKTKAKKKTVIAKMSTSAPVPGYSGDHAATDGDEAFAACLEEEDLEFLDEMVLAIGQNRSWIMRASIQAFADVPRDNRDYSKHTGELTKKFTFWMDEDRQRTFYKLQHECGRPGSWLTRAAFKHYRKLFEQMSKKVA